MSNLPQFLRRLPYVFYGLGAAFFIWTIVNQWMTLEYTQQYADPDGNPMSLLGKSMAFMTASSEAAYMLANGAMLHVLIAIHDRLTER